MSAQPAAADVRQSLLHFTDYTSAHGLGRLGSQSSRCGRLMWLSFLVLTYCGFSYHMYCLAVHFLSVPLTTGVTADLQFQFPDLYLCPSDPVTMSRVGQQVESGSELGSHSYKRPGFKPFENSLIEALLKFDIANTSFPPHHPGSSFSDAAQALSDAVKATEDELVESLQFSETANPALCRTTHSGQEYSGNLSTVPVYSDGILFEPLTPGAPLDLSRFKPYVTHRPCIGWNAAARALAEAGGDTIARRILALNYSEGERRCRQPPGLPLTDLESVATYPIRKYLGCFSNATLGAAFSICGSMRKRFDYDRQEMPDEDRVDYDMRWSTENCAHCCYGRKFTHMGLSPAGCHCALATAGGIGGIHLQPADDGLCTSRCPYGRHMICGGEQGYFSVYQVRDAEPKPLILASRTAISSLSDGPYCFYRDEDMQLSAAYCNVPYCPVSPIYDCVASDESDQASRLHLTRYTGYQRSDDLNRDCLNWSSVADELMSRDPNIVRVHVETPDFGLGAGHNFCRLAKVMADYLWMNGTYFRRNLLTLSAKPACFSRSDRDGWARFRVCQINTCYRTVRGVSGALGDRTGRGLLARQFGSDLGVGFTQCSFAGQRCSVEDFETLLHPDLGLCHRFRKDRFADLLTRKKATDAKLTLCYFTDSTDSLGQRFANISKLGHIVQPAMDAEDGTRSAMRVVVVPRDQYPWPSDAISLSPGQHTDLRLRYHKTTRFPKPPKMKCVRDVKPVTYMLSSWNTSWIQFNESLSLTDIFSAGNWTAKSDALRRILLELNSKRGPMRDAREFPSAVQQDCINTYKVQQFVSSCGCLPYFLPIPVQFASNRHCFNQSDMHEIHKAEQCHARQMQRMYFYEVEARRKCPPPCETRGYKIRLASHPWPGLRPENALPFLLSHLGDWSYPQNYMLSRGVAGIYYVLLRAKRLARLHADKWTAGDVAELANELSKLEEQLVQISVSASDDFGDEITEEPAYTVKDLMADLGGALGLWSGVSVLTVCELFELLSCLVVTIQRKLSEPSSAKRNDAAADGTGLSLRGPREEVEASNV